jgi:hypothetical protein
MHPDESSIRFPLPPDERDHEYNEIHQYSPEDGAATREDNMPGWWKANGKLDDEIARQMGFGKALDITPSLATATMTVKTDQDDERGACFASDLDRAPEAESRSLSTTPGVNPSDERGTEGDTGVYMGIEGTLSPAPSTSSTSQASLRNQFLQSTGYFDVPQPMSPPPPLQPRVLLGTESGPVTLQERDEIPTYTCNFAVLLKSTIHVTSPTPPSVPAPTSAPPVEPQEPPRKRVRRPERTLPKRSSIRAPSRKPTRSKRSSPPSVPKEVRPSDSPPNLRAHIKEESFLMQGLSQLSGFDFKQKDSNAKQEGDG